MPYERFFDSERGERFNAAVERWIAQGRPTVEPRVAATVLLVRDGVGGPEVFVQERAATMAFAPAMVVFPGGRVDDADALTDVPDPVLATLAARMGVDGVQTRSIVGAAIREVEEECGVSLMPDALRPRARWVTPVLEPRRYDTWFFAARMPEDQEARGTTRETVQEEWGRASDLLAAGAAGRLRLMPPTIVALEDLSAFSSVDAFLADAPPMTVVEPHLVRTESGWALRSLLPDAGE